MPKPWRCSPTDRAIRGLRKHGGKKTMAEICAVNQGVRFSLAAFPPIFTDAATFLRMNSFSP